MFDMKVKRLVVNAASSGDNALLPADPTLEYQVMAGMLVAAGAVSVKFTDGASGDELTGAMAMAANGIMPIAFNPEGHVRTSKNKALVLNLSGAVAVRGWLTVYVYKVRSDS